MPPTTRRSPSCSSHSRTPRHAGSAATLCAAAAGLLASGGCAGPQSALAPAGLDAERIADLFWWMLAGAVLIWTLVIGLAVYAQWRPGRHSLRASYLLILVGGVLFPTLVLAGLLAYGLSLLPGLHAAPPAGALTISVAGEQWWWRVRYPLPDGTAVELANEIRLPVGERVELRLESPDVIHSFWVPSLGGKIDMIPGRTNRLMLEPTRTGVFRGACAEYCGTSHALMQLVVVVMEREAFAAWLAQQAAPVARLADPAAGRGQAFFLANGCGACHTIRGTPANGVIGPDLTHVGGRLTLGAGLLPNEAAAFERWIARTDALKPGVRMPAFAMLPHAELSAIATYLDGLR